MRYLLLENFKIINDDASFVVGSVRPTNGREGPFRVFASVTADFYCGSIEVATVHSFEECVTALANYYEKNPPRWVRRSAGWYEKETLYSNLRVEQDQRGRWRVYRDSFPLLHERGYPATFYKLDEAQRVADIHLLDNYPNAKPAIDDGFWWLIDPEINWRLLPEDVALRAQWKPLASLWRPQAPT
jgi:hypothetical protein